MRKMKWAVLCALACALPSGFARGQQPAERPAVPPPAAAPAELPSHPDSLLTDEQLVPTADPFPAFGDPATASWIRANHHPVRSLTSGDFSDLQFLKPILAGRRVVQLGESGHGVREFNLAKVRLIRFLHEEMGYDVIAFESGLLDCWLADQDVPRVEPVRTLGNCVFGVWATREVLELFEYVHASRSTPRPLRLAGFDIQTSGLKVLGRPVFFREVASRVDTAFARRAFRRDSLHVAAKSGPRAGYLAYLRENREPLLATYDSLARLFEANQARLDAADPARPGLGGVARMAARSVRLNLQHALDTVSTSEIRDRGMADNLTFLLRELYPDRKVIVWAHNAHIRHAGGSTTYIPSAMMGSVVAERHRAELYTIGFYMYRGVSAKNDRQPAPVTRHTNNSLESILYRTRRRWAFVDLLGQSRGPGREWMFDSTWVKEWGTHAYRMVPRQQYDGIFFVHDVSMPEYLPNPRAPSGAR